MKPLRALLGVLVLCLASHVAYADDPCKPDPLMKDVIEADSAQKFSDAYNTFYQSDEGKSWANSQSGGVSLGIPIDSIPIKLSGQASSSQIGSMFHDVKQMSGNNEQQELITRVRKSIASSELWKGYMECEKEHSVSNVDVTLEPVGNGAAMLTLTYTTQTGAIPFPTILDVEVAGGSLGNTTWPGSILNHAMTQLVTREKGEPLAVTVETTIAPGKAQLDAVQEIDLTAITMPECDPCPPAPQPQFPLPWAPGSGVSAPQVQSTPSDGLVCTGRYYEAWKYKLTMEHLPTDDRSDGPLETRRQYLMTRCLALYEQARSLAHVVSIRNDTASGFQQRQQAYQDDVQGHLAQAKAQMEVLAQRAQANGDTKMADDQPKLLSPLQFFCKNPQMRFIDDPRTTTEAASGADCTGVTTWPPADDVSAN